MAFGAARQLLEPAVFGAGAAQRRLLLAGPAQLGANALGLATGEAPGDEFAARHGLYWLCANLAERTPVLIAVDDLQWVDRPSLAWLLYLARRAVDLPAPGRGDACARMILALVRPPRPWWPTIRRSGGRGWLRWAGQRRGRGGRSPRPDGEPGIRLACWELTGGNPLFVRQLAAAARGEGMTGDPGSVDALRSLAPSAVGASVLPRLARMGPDAIALARALAVLGAGTEVAVAAELADLAPSAAELAADTLTAAQILGATRPLEFFHPVIGEAVYGALAPGARRLAHRRAAAIADRDGGLGLTGSLRT